MNKTKPPKDREFLGLVVSGNNVYWDIAKVEVDGQWVAVELHQSK